MLSKIFNKFWYGSIKFNLIRMNAIRGIQNNGFEEDLFENLIFKNTVITTNHLTPELKLRLITPECKLWNCPASLSEFPSDPFWGIYWPGGQVLGRFILDNKHLFMDKNVLDIGSGCGACAVAAAKSGAKIVLANDIDEISIKAIKINSVLNSVELFTSEDNLIGGNIDSVKLTSNNKEIIPIWDVILVGDMFYDSEFSVLLFTWLSMLAKKNKTVLVGDPGRHALKDLNQLKDLGKLIKCCEYELRSQEHNGFSCAAIYKTVMEAEAPRQNQQVVALYHVPLVGTYNVPYIGTTESTSGGSREGLSFKLKNKKISISEVIGCIHSSVIKTN